MSNLADALRKFDTLDDAIVWAEGIVLEPDERAAPRVRAFVKSGEWIRRRIGDNALDLMSTLSEDATPRPWAVCEVAYNDLWHPGSTILSMADATPRRVADVSILSGHTEADAALIVHIVNWFRAALHGEKP